MIEILEKIESYENMSLPEKMEVDVDELLAEARDAIFSEPSESAKTAIAMELTARDLKIEQLEADKAELLEMVKELLTPMDEALEASATALLAKHSNKEGE